MCGTTNNGPAAPPAWHLVGAGNMGTLATCYLRQAGHSVTVIRGRAEPTLDKMLIFRDNASSHELSLPVVAPHALATPVRHLLLACKTPYAAAALAPLRLARDVVVLRLQNGLGSLTGLLPDAAHLIEVVTTSAVRGTHPYHEIVAENETWMGGTTARPNWFNALTQHWPRLAWCDDIRWRQWHKLVANAVINPLTGLYDVPNGRLLDDPNLRAQMTRLAAEADTLLARLDARWPRESAERVAAVAHATADNTSSMRADMQRGAITEIDAINGWLLQQANAQGIPMAAHRAITDAVRARHPQSP